MHPHGGCSIKALPQTDSQRAQLVELINYYLLYPLRQSFRR